MWGKSKNDPTRAQRFDVPASIFLPRTYAIGKLTRVTGSLSLRRGELIIAQPAVGDFLYEGDLIETGPDGQVAIVLLDGTTFDILASARVMLGEFVYDHED